MDQVYVQLKDWRYRAQIFFNLNSVAIARKITQEVAGGGTSATVISFRPGAHETRNLVEFKHTLRGTDFANLRALPPQLFLQHLVYIIRHHTGFRTRASRYSGSRWITVYFPIGASNGDSASIQDKAIDAFMDMVTTDSAGSHLRVTQQ